MSLENYPSPLDSLSPDEFYESYEELFEDDDSISGPCYLPEKNQDSEKDVETGQQIGEIMDVVMNSDESRDTIIEGCCLDGGEIENKTEFNEGGIGENSALNEGQIEENSLLNEGQTGENCDFNGRQIEGNSYPHEGRMGESFCFKNGDRRGISARHEGDFEEKSTLLLGESTVKEDGISEAENVSGSNSVGYEAGTSTSVSASSSLSSVIEDGNLGQSDDSSSGADWNGTGHENEFQMNTYSSWSNACATKSSRANAG